MAVEAVAAIGAGIVARSVLLTAFGFDSVIELLSAGVLLWRFRIEMQGALTERLERIDLLVTTISAGLLSLLCLYVLLSSATGLFLGLQPEPSVGGLAIALAAVIAMPVLAWRKSRLNQTLGSAALRADIAETLTCAYMAAATLFGVALNILLHWWWADYLAALLLLFWLIQETREAIDAAREAQLTERS